MQYILRISWGGQIIATVVGPPQLTDTEHLHIRYMALQLKTYRHQLSHLEDGIDVAQKEVDVAAESKQRRPLRSQDSGEQWIMDAVTREKLS